MDKARIEQLYTQYASWIFNRARSIVKDEQLAWEAVQDVFIKVLESGDSFRGDSSPWTWLYRITTNHCLNMIRSQKAGDRALDGLEREQLRLSHDPQDPVYDVLMNRDWFVKLMADEDGVTQRIVLAYYFDELSQEEIVDLLKISRKTVYKRLKKFMERARAKLGPSV